MNNIPNHQPVTVEKTVISIPAYQIYPERALHSVFDETGRNLYPYRLNDHIGGPRQSRQLDVIVIENAHLRLELVPELGGKIFSCYDLNRGHHALYVPEVLKPGLVGKTGAWIPGGLEFNFPTGHHEETVKPVSLRIIESSPERGVVRMERTCKRTGLRITVDTELRAGEARFLTHVVLKNPTELARDWSYWANVGIEAGDDWQFQCWGDRCLSSEPPLTSPWPVIDGEDASWLRHAWTANDRFVLGCDEEFFGSYRHASECGFLHCARQTVLPGKKFFTWGSKQPLHHFSRLFSDRSRNYIEIQAGAAPTQHHRAMMQAGERIAFTSTWAPFADTGGLTWANADLVMGTRGETPIFYALRPLNIQFVAGQTTWSHELQAGQTVAFPHSVQDGTACAIRVDNTCVRSFQWPFRGKTDSKVATNAEAFMKDQRQEPRSAADHLKKAKRLLATGREQAARALLERAIEQSPACGEALYLLGESLWRSGLFPEGRRILNAIDAPPWDERATALLACESAVQARFKTDATDEAQMADALAGRGAGTAAVPHYKKCLRDPRHQPTANLALASHAMRIDADRDRALSHIRRALAALPADRDILVACGEMLANLHAYQTLEQALDKASPAVRHLQWYTKYRSLALYENGKTRAAWQLLSRKPIVPWECETRWYMLYRHCAEQLLRDALTTGQRTAAWRYLAAVEAYPERLGIAEPQWPCNPTAAYWRGVLHLEAGRFAAAQESFRAGASIVINESRYALRLTADISCYHAGLCSLAERGDRTVAPSLLRLIDRTVTQYETWYAPASPWLRGQLLELRGDYEAAADQFTKCLRYGTGSRYLRQHLSAVEQGRRWGVHT